MDEKILVNSVPSFYQPYVSRNLVDSWCVNNAWSLENLSKIHEDKIKFRVGKRDVFDQKETECSIVHGSLIDLKDWLNSKTCKNLDFQKIDKNNHWLYGDYIYLKENPSFSFIENNCKWSDILPFKEYQEKSTVWFGTKGAYTHLHYDTYGVNLVAQLYGRKRWILFPPTESDKLYPTRVPFEESTVFSEVNIKKPNFSVHPKFSDSLRFEVIVNPGDVLFVPKHWWHFVESLDDFTFSMNLWLDQGRLDNQERISELLTQISTFMVHENFPDLPTDILLHPKEFELFLGENWNENLIDDLNNLINSSSIIQENNSDFLCDKNIKWEPIERTSTSIERNNSIKKTKSHFTLTSCDILKAFTHPKTIKTIQDILLNKS